jgi:hypothetical protein
MAKKKILYVSGSIGLGHITRDLAIARQLCRQSSEVELSWLACHPATLLLNEAGEKLLPEADIYVNANIHAENIAKGFEMSTLKYALNEIKILKHNLKIYKKIFNRERFDLVISDEGYDLITALAMKFIRLECPFVMIYDFLGMDSVTKNPFEKLLLNNVNYTWIKWDRKLFPTRKIWPFSQESQKMSPMRNLVLSCQTGVTMPGSSTSSQDIFCHSNRQNMPTRQKFELS